MKAAAPGNNDVELVLDGQTLILKASVEAAIAVSRLNGGLVPTVAKLSHLDFDTCQRVVEAGLGKSSKDLAGLIFKTGLANVSPVCIVFCNRLAAGPGGKLPGDDDEDDEGGEKKKPPLDTSA